MSARKFLKPAPLFLFTLAGVGGTAKAQFTFSIDYFGPTNGLPNGFTAAPIRPSDILTPFTAGIGVAGMPALGPLPIPGTMITGGVPGLSIGTYAGCVGAPPGIPCPNEVDALSYGADPIPQLGQLQLPGTWVFSVDEFAKGIPGLLAPNVLSEGPATGVIEACGDVFASLGLPGGPVGPGVVSGNTAIVDGNGLPSLSGAVYPGVGIKEPRPPMAGPGPRPGDNIDALDFGPGPTAALGGVYFSLDGGFFDPLRGVPNTGSAGANGFLPGMILQVPVPGAFPIVYAPPPLLGLDLLGPGTDDLDALALRENGVFGYQPGGDIVRFSVRRGSAVIGLLDSLQGLPIEPGDILGPPLGPGMPPQIIVCAEALGLATFRSGFAGFGMGDDMDGLDAMQPLTTATTSVTFCIPGTNGVVPCPCANPPVGAAGCNNSSATGGATMTAAGGASLGFDTLVFTTAGEKPTATSIVLQGNAVAPAGIVFGQGIRCVAGTLKRLYVKTAVGGSITAPVGADPTVSARSAALGDVIGAGTYRYYGVYYRDPIVLGGCPAASTFNISSQLAVYWMP